MSKQEESEKETYTNRDNIASTASRVRIRATCVAEVTFGVIEHKRHEKKEEKGDVTDCWPLNVFVYPLNVIGEPVHENVPESHGFVVVVRLSTTLQPSS